MRRIVRTPGHLAGFYVARPAAAVAELHDVGDEWLPEQRLMDWHSHPGWELYLQVAGESTRSDDAGAWPLVAGDAFLAPPQRRHRVINRGTTSQHNRFARFALGPVLDRHPELRDLWNLPHCRHLPAAQELLSPFAHLIDEITFDRHGRDIGLRLALDGVVLAASRLLAGTRSRVLVPIPTEVLAAQRLLRESCQRPWRLRALAEAVQLSASHLRALFRTHLGIAPHGYLLQCRLERARELLRTSDAPITAMAVEVGFSSSQHFAKAFKAEMGCSARSFRRATDLTPEPQSLVDPDDP